MKRRIVDIHNHMLFGVDDGSYSLENSLEMAELSCESGVTDVICTPHCYPGMFENYAGTGFEKNFEKLKEALNDEGIPLNLHLGMEVFGHYETLDDLKNNKLYCLAGSRYMLIEFDFNDNPENVNYILEDLLDYDIVPIIAHPERYNFVAKAPTILFNWLDMGCLLQCNKDSISGKFGNLVKKISIDMLSDRLFSFIGSDAHGATRRTPYMQFAYEFVEENFGNDYAEEIFFKNPLKIINNSEI